MQFQARQKKPWSRSLRVLVAEEGEGSSPGYFYLLVDMLAAVFVVILVLRHLGLVEIRVTCMTPSAASGATSRSTSTCASQTLKVTNLFHVLEVGDITLDGLRKLSTFMGLRAGQTRPLPKTDLESRLTAHARERGFEVIIVGGENAINF